jgi:hypothetical protein
MLGWKKRPLPVLLSIFVRIDNFSSLSQLLQEIVIGDYEIKITNNELVKIQSPLLMSI